MFSTSVIGGEIFRRSGMKQKEQENTGKQTGGFRKVVKKAKEDWIGAQCEEIKPCLNRNNSKRAYQLVKDLTPEKQGRSSTIQDKSRKYLTEKQEILSRWTEYFPDLHNYNGMANPMDSVANYYPTYKGQLAALPELQNYQPNQFFEQSHDESHLEYT